MAIFRIAIAAIAIYYIAPHLGSQMAETARPLVNSAKQELTGDSLTQAALGFCQKNPETCARMARSALSSEITTPAQTSNLQVSLRPGLPDKPPLPPARPLDLRPAFKP